MTSDLTHFDDEGRPRMVDVSAKPETGRVAAARGFVRTQRETLHAASAKGDVARVAELAGVMAAKKTAELIPLCHTLPLTSVSVLVAPDESLPGYRVHCEVRTTGRTGVEMEALTAASIACLTIYDMLKSKDRGMTIERVELVSKSGGASGDWRRE